MLCGVCGHGSLNFLRVNRDGRVGVEFNKQSEPKGEGKVTEVLEIPELMRNNEEIRTLIRNALG